MAVRFSCPIYTYESILEEAGVIFEETEEQSIKVDQKTKTKSVGFDRYTSEELNNLLKDVLADEDYEKAAQIRDELNKRK